jgi:hypothetical protein
MSNNLINALPSLRKIASISVTNSSENLLERVDPYLPAPSLSVTLPIATEIDRNNPDLFAIDDSKTRKKASASQRISLEKVINFFRSIF